MYFSCVSSYFSLCSLKFKLSYLVPQNRFFLKLLSILLLFVSCVKLQKTTRLCEMLLQRNTILFFQVPGPLYLRCFFFCFYLYVNCAGFSSFLWVSNVIANTYLGRFKGFMCCCYALLTGYPSGNSNCCLFYELRPLPVRKHFWCILL